MSSVRFTSDSLTSTTLPTLTAAFHIGWWSQIRTGGYSPAGDSAIVGFGTAGGSSQGFQLSVGAGATTLVAFTFANGGSAFDPHTIATGSNTSWRAYVLQYSGTGTAYTLRFRLENVTTWTSVTIDCGVALTTVGGLYIGCDQFTGPDEFIIDGNVKGFWCQATSISDAAALTASQNARQGIAPSGTNLHWLDLDSSTNVGVNGGTAGNWTVGGSPATDASEPVESGGGTTVTVDAGTDSVASTDSLARSASYGRLPGDAQAVSDSVLIEGQHLIDLGANDTQAVSDSLSTTLYRVLAVAVSDTVAVTDSSEWDLYFPADAVSSTDTTSRGAEFGRGLSDAVANSDSASRGAEFGRAPNDSIATSDATSPALELGRSGSDSVSSSDATALEATYERSLADSVAASDTVTAQTTSPSTLDVQVSDTATSTDSSQLELTYGRALSDSLTGTDSSQLELTSARSGSDSVSTTDSGSSSLELGRVLADTVSATDGLVLEAQYVRALSDSVVATEDLQVQLTSPSTLDVQVNDSLSVSDSLANQAQYARTLSDSVTSTDLVTAQLFRVLDVSASDSISATDAVTASKEATIDVQVSDTMVVSDQLGTTLEYYRALSDSALSTDAVVRDVDWIRVLADTVTTSDTVSVNVQGPGLDVVLEDSVELLDLVVAQSLSAIFLDRSGRTIHARPQGRGAPGRATDRSVKVDPYDDT